LLDSLLQEIIIYKPVISCPSFMRISSPKGLVILFFDIQDAANNRSRETRTIPILQS